MIWLKSNLTLRGFEVRNRKQSAVCLKIKNRKWSRILRIKYNKNWNCVREREMPGYTTGERLGQFYSKHRLPFGPCTSEAVTSSLLEAPWGKGWERSIQPCGEGLTGFHHSSQRVSPLSTNSRSKASKSWFFWWVHTLLEANPRESLPQIPASEPAVRRLHILKIQTLESFCFTGHKYLYMYQCYKIVVNWNHTFIIVCNYSRILTGLTGIHVIEVIIEQGKKREDFFCFTKWFFELSQ